ncbi:hypothetical protein PMIN07_008703 [Paraphaeosphaeria minitans]
MTPHRDNSFGLEQQQTNYSTQAADPVQSPRPSDTNLAQDFMPVSVIETKEVTKKRKRPMSVANYSSKIGKDVKPS